MRLTHEEYVEHVRADAARILAVAGRGLDAVVPSCPGWTVRDAVEHIAEVYRHKVSCIREKAFPEPWPTDRGDEPTLDYFRQATDELLTELTTRDALEYADTWWWDERTVGFWGRRMAHESAIHRIDVELAYDHTTPIDDALALDGVDEVLRRFLAGDWSDEPVADQPATFVRVESGGTAWRVVMEPNAIVASVYLDRWPELAIDATVSGDPLPMYLWLWGRGPRDQISIDGDHAAAERMDARLRLATQ
ncbi:MAG TPA: maleylpyruvate isomerase family mycothiol-dependent enzyme [Jiangellaceae bacterium]